MISCGIVMWGVGWTDSLAGVATAVLEWLVDNLGWLFVLAATGFVIFTLCVALGRYGRIPLGRDGEPPEFRTVSWVAMMFSAGMGIGLMFYGVTEPLTHFVTPPPGVEQGIGTAMATTLFHWTLHPWAMYAVMGLALAYGTYRRGRPQL
ncbi:MAG: BCCT family transporter, partial [Pseudonocardiaceae bacterium]